MKNTLLLSLAAFAALATGTVAAEKLPSDVRTVLDKYSSSLPAEEDLTVYRLDWAASLDEAKQRAERQRRPILLIVVTNSYGNLYTGHC